MLRELIKLAGYLDGVGLEKEAEMVESFLEEKIPGVVFMHLGGPSGSGKSSLLENIHRLYPQVICKDLDEFDEEASEDLGLEWGWKNSEDLWNKWGEKQFKKKQKLLDDFLSAHKGKKIILGGISSEGGYSLSFLPQFRILLNTPLEESLSRRIKRDKSHPGAYPFWEDPESLEVERREGGKIIEELKSQNYRPLSVSQILDLLKKSMQKEKK